MMPADKKDDAVRKSTRINLGVPPRRLGFDEEDSAAAENKGFSCTKGTENQSLKSAGGRTESRSNGGGSEKTILTMDGSRSSLTCKNKPKSSQRSSSSSGRIKRREAEIELEALKKFASLQEQIIQAEKKVALAKLDEEEEDCAGPENTSETDSFHLNKREHIHKYLSGCQSLVASEDVRFDSKPIVLPEVDKGQRIESIPANTDSIKIMADAITACFQKITDQRAENKIVHSYQNRDLPIFSGNITEFPIWFAEFKRSTEEFHISDSENLRRLQKCLTGSAKEITKCLYSSPHNVSAIIDSLKMNFGRSDWIIQSLINEVRDTPNLKDDGIETFLQLSNAVSNMVVTMINLNCERFLVNPDLMSALESKLPRIQKREWAMLKNNFEEDFHDVDLRDFSSWLKKETNALMSVHKPLTSNTITSATRVVSKREKILNIEEKSNGSDKCFLCKTDHLLRDCKKFMEKSVPDRRKLLEENSLCFLCLKSKHNARKCFSKRRCSIKNCGKKHHSLVHVEEKEVVLPKKEEVNIKSSASALLKMVKVCVGGPTGTLETFAILDEGSTVTLMNEETAKKIGATGPKVPICYQWTNEVTHHEDSSEKIEVNICASDNDESFSLRARTVNNLQLSYQKLDPKEMEEKYPYIPGCIVQQLKDARPTILIGQDNVNLIVTQKFIQPFPNELMASQCKLGWSIHGPINSAKTHHVLLNICYDEDDYLHTLIKDTLQCENFGNQTCSEDSAKSREDKQALEIFDKTSKRVGDRFEIGLPWRNVKTPLPCSYPMAYNRLLCLERKMDKNPEFGRRYADKIAEYVEKGYAKKLPSHQCIESESEKIWYLPHFGVFNINKPNKLRPVFDAAAKCNGVCLNDFLLQGPDYVPNLVAVLMRFRQKKVGFSGDIKEMFHQISIRKKDRAAQRFLFRGMERSMEPDVYEMQVMIFGNISSPSIAQYIKNKNALEFEDEFNGIERIMVKQHYVDDYLDSADTEEEAMKTIFEVIEVHRRGGFQMLNWASNYGSVIESLPIEYRASSCQSVDMNANPMERVLGIQWLPKEDVLMFDVDFKKIPKAIYDGSKIPTKRQMLQLVMSIFDPIGLLSPVAIKGRIILQAVWKDAISWDDEVSQEIFRKWYVFLKEVESCSNIRIPRCYFSTISKVNEVDMHVFCDAGEQGYSAMVYMVTREEQNLQTALVLAKAKVSPIKKMSVPRLELLGAVLAVRLSNTVKQETEFAIIETHYWTDSYVVLSWIKTDVRRLLNFVAHRVTEIENLSDIKSWKWVPTHLNPADIATKDKHRFDDTLQQFWFHGPEFLRLSN